MLLEHCAPGSGRQRRTIQKGAKPARYFIQAGAIAGPVPPHQVKANFPVKKIVAEIRIRFDAQASADAEPEIPPQLIPASPERTEFGASGGQYMGFAPGQGDSPILAAQLVDQRRHHRRDDVPWPRAIDVKRAELGHLRIAP
ncbi:hypothetical protein [Sphingobium sp. C100]|uniref:hypothetical protein n=1 Tax=Sphingobium sp. C100 TaxID=1207055 RepID=UPI001F1D4A46|nr:hypothetical protein [Sphingobium sp. C100]